VDSNSPVHWIDGQMVVYNSNGVPSVAWGENLFSLGTAQRVAFSNEPVRPLWIEATWQDADGTLFAWYHHEPPGVCPKQGNIQLTSPKIGALISHDGGAAFEDLGIVMEAGGYLYFFFGNYGGPDAGQGVAMARMAIGDRWNPAGNLWKYSGGDAWDSPGLGGPVTPLFPARVDWGEEAADAFWGPSVQWNTHLKKYVMLLNRSCCRSRWPLEGFYVSFAADLADPESWSTPRKFADGRNYYPQAIGLAPGETDKRMGETARFFVGGISDFEIFFDLSGPDGEGGGGYETSKAKTINK
jgi:hypothetical protein